MSAMKLFSCWIIFFYLPIFGVLILTLNADSVDSDCYTEFRVRRNTVYNASLGQELSINCTVIFCNNSPPTVTWEKLVETDVPVNVSSDSHIKTPYVPVDVSNDSRIKAEWKHIKKSTWISYLIFSKIQRNDSGQYRCQSGGSVGHFISVSVSDSVKLTTASWTTLAAVTVIPANTFYPFLYRVIGILVFVIIVILTCVIPKRRCKGKLRKTTTPSEEPPHHVYDNDL